MATPLAEAKKCARSRVNMNGAWLPIDGCIPGSNRPVMTLSPTDSDSQTTLHDDARNETIDNHAPLVDVPRHVADPLQEYDDRVFVLVKERWWRPIRCVMPSTR
jgi:hypothetical protein